MNPLLSTKRVASFAEICAAYRNAGISPASGADFMRVDSQTLDVRLALGARLLWVDYGGSPGVISRLRGSQFVMFDTAYHFRNEPDEAARARFHVAQSVGDRRWLGFRRFMFQDFEREFAQIKRDFGVEQTGIACVHSSRLSEFLEASSCM